MLKSFGRRNEPEGADGRPAGDNNDMSTRDALENKVRERDSTLSSLERQRSEKEAELEGLRKELEEERLKQMQNSILHRLEKDRLQRQTQAMEERLEVLERDMQDKEAIQEYANLIKGVAPENGVDSQYVMKLQAQLAKAVKKMDATTHQMTLVEQSCNEVISSLKAEIAEIVEERCRNEFELRKQLELLDEQKAEMQADFEKQIRKNQEEMERLKLRANGETAEDLEKQIEETESKLEDIHRVHNKQDEEIEELNAELNAALESMQRRQEERKAELEKLETGSDVDGVKTEDAKKENDDAVDETNDDQNVDEEGKADDNEE